MKFLPLYGSIVKYLRATLFLLPILILIVYLGILYLVLGYADNVLFDPHQALVVSFFVALSLSPIAALEYKLEYDVIELESEIPIYLAALENAVRSGLSLPQALIESSKFTKRLGRDVGRIVSAMWAGVPISKALKASSYETPLLTVFKDFLKVLITSGEEIYKSIGDFRESTETIVGYMRKLRQGTKSYIVSIYMVLIVYVVTTAIFIHFFVQPLAEEAVETPILSFVDANAITALCIYGALMEAVINGVAVSYFTGSRYMSALIHTLFLLYPSLIIYTIILYM
jgi:hypothetical protein